MPKMGTAPAGRPGMRRGGGEADSSGSSADRGSSLSVEACRRGGIGRPMTGIMPVRVSDITLGSKPKVKLTHLDTTECSHPLRQRLSSSDLWINIFLLFSLSLAWYGLLVRRSILRLLAG